MTPRLLTLDRIWLLVLTVLLLLSIAGNAALLQASNDSPVHVYSASTNDQAAGGASTYAADSITGTSHDELVRVRTGNLSAAHTHTCVVTASALAEHYSGDGQFVFGLSMDNVNGSAIAAERRIEMSDNPSINDDNYEEVSTTYAFTGVAGSHTFYFWARKLNTSDNTLIVAASSMTVICIKKSLPPSAPDGSAD